MKMISVTIGLLGLGLTAFAADFWKDKAYTQWSDDEVTKMLSSSPWAQSTKASAPNQGAGQRGGRGGRGGGGGMGGPRIGFPGGGGGAGGGGGGVRASVFRGVVAAATLAVVAVTPVAAGAVILGAEAADPR